MGDNIRGTMLGAVDTVSKTGETKNDFIAQKGRQETADGLSKLKGVPVSSQRYGVGASNATGAAPVQPAHQGYTGNTTVGQSGGHHGEFPQHHRDEAISNDPDAIAVGQEYQGVQPQTGNAPASQYASAAAAANNNATPSYPTANRCVPVCYCMCLN